MPAHAKRSIPVLVPLLLACAVLLTPAAACLGGTPLGRALRSAEVAAPPSGSAPGEEREEMICVVIDAGHGGEDGGTASAAGVLEKDVNLSVAFALRDLFEAAGIPVVMTRTEDKLLYDRSVDFHGRKKALDLAARRIVAEKTAEAAAEGGGTSLFISIHMNAFPAPQYSGMQVWYGVGALRSAEVAAAIQSASLSIRPDNHRRIKAAGSNIYLLDRIRSPAVLVECGFLSNPEEAELLSKEDYQRAVAAVIFAGVVGC